MELPAPYFIIHELLSQWSLFPHTTNTCSENPLQVEMFVFLSREFLTSAFLKTVSLCKACSFLKYVESSCRVSSTSSTYNKTITKFVTSKECALWKSGERMLTTGVWERGVGGANYLTALEERGLCHDPDTLVFPIDFKRRSKDPLSGTTG